MSKRILLLPVIAFLATLGPSKADAAPPKRLLRKMSFSQDWSRYPSPDVILSTLQMQFPLAKVDQSSPGCVIVTPDNRSILGESSPLTGSPVVKNPNSSFVVWYSGCLKEFLKSEFFEFTRQYSNGAPTDRDALVKVYLTEKSLALYPIDTKQGDWRTSWRWMSIKPADRIAIIESEIERLVGPDEVVRDLTLGTSVNELATRIDAKLNEIINKNPEAFSFLALSFSTGRPDTVESIRAVRFLILLADTLKY